MVFPSIPVYLDPPNWQQQQQPHQFIGGGNGQEQTLDQLPPLPPPPPPAGGPARPGSMADRARMAKVVQPEAALKCPRCESTNTKFCYYNNYSLSQPRYFCKTCRRYWTRGGALRNVPVGGGCRRNKRSKGRGGSKSPAMVVVSGGATTTAGVGALPSPPVPPPTQLPFLPPLQSLSDYGDVDFQNNGSGGGGGVGQIGSSGLLIGEQWRVHQFPFLTNLATTPAGGLFHFEGEGMNNGSQLGLNLPRNLLGISGNYDQSSWSHDVPGFTSSTSTTHHL